MYSRFELALKYLKYYFSSSSGKGHGIHSPFVFEFVTKVLNDQERYPDYKKVEGLRKKLLKDEIIIEVSDFGAGSSVSRSSNRSIKSIASHAAKPGKYGQLLYRITRFYKPATVLDLGTSLGITTSYLSFGNTSAKLITAEGSPAIASIAKGNFRMLNLQNIELLVGEFNGVLPVALSKLSKVDLAFIDGNHQREPTLNYFLQLLEHRTPGSIFIFDDIHWSSEMEEAWTTIKSHPAVRCSIDLFFIGIVLFREEFREKQHFTIRF